MVAYHESQINVAYPTEVYDDDEVTVTGIIPPKPRSRVSFLRGWAFVVDLYRILEHATDHLRSSRIGGATALDDVTGLYTRKLGPSEDEVMGTVADMYNALPDEFKRADPMTGCPELDRYGYTGEHVRAHLKTRPKLMKAANIIITLQVLRSVVAGTEVPDVNQRCSIAAETLDALATIPKSYLIGCSAPAVSLFAPCRALCTLYRTSIDC